MESIEVHSKDAQNIVKNPKKVEQQIYEAINKKYPTNHSYRMFVNALVDSSFKHVIYLIILDQLPSAYVEMHGVVEESAIRFFPKNMKVKENASILRELIDRKTLKDLIPYYVQLDLWTKEDATFAKKLANIRNGVAHRNFDLLFKYVGGEPDPNFISKYDDVNFKSKEAINAFALSIELCIKIFKTNSRNKKNA